MMKRMGGMAMRGGKKGKKGKKGGGIRRDAAAAAGDWPADAAGCRRGSPAAADRRRPSQIVRLAR